MTYNVSFFKIYRFWVRGSEKTVSQNWNWKGMWFFSRQWSYWNAQKAFRSITNTLTGGRRNSKVAGLHLTFSFLLMDRTIQTLLHCEKVFFLFRMSRIQLKNYSTTAFAQLKGVLWRNKVLSERRYSFYQVEEQKIRWAFLEVFRERQYGETSKKKSKKSWKTYRCWVFIELNQNSSKSDKIVRKNCGKSIWNQHNDRTSCKLCTKKQKVKLT